MNIKYIVSILSLSLLISCNNKKLKNNIKKETSSNKEIEDNIKLSSSIDTLFYNQDWELTSKKEASFYRPLNFKQKNGLWEIKDYYISGKLQYIAYSRSKEEEVWEGKAIWYSENGTIIQQTSYFKGIEMTEENANKIKQEKIYSTYGIEKKNSEVFLSMEIGNLSQDSIPDYVFLFNDDNSDRIPNKRLLIQLNDKEGIFYDYEFLIEKDNYLDNVSIKNNQLILNYKDQRRLTNWKRSLIFKLEEQDTSKVEDYDEYFEPNFILKKDTGFASYPYYNKKISVHKNSSNFGNVFLANIKFKDSTNNYTWASLQKTTNFQDYKYQYEDEFDMLYSLLDSIKDNKTIHIKKGIYNFSKISYNNNGSKDKEVTVENGALYIKGYSNIKFIAEEGVYFVSNDTHSDIIDFVNCQNIEIKNINAVHNVKETFCEAPVFSINNSKNITFDNCIVDGSGEYGFYITNNSGNVKILNTTIKNCSSNAVVAYKSEIFMDNVKIINNEFSGSILDVNHSTIEMKNCIIKDNTVQSINYFDVRFSKLKMDNVNLEAILNNNESSVLFYISNKTDEVLIKNSTITLNNKEKLFRTYSPIFIESEIIEKIAMLFLLLKCN